MYLRMSIGKIKKNEILKLIPWVRRALAKELTKLEILIGYGDNFRDICILKIGGKSLTLTFTSTWFAIIRVPHRKKQN